MPTKPFHQHRQDVFRLTDQHFESGTTSVPALMRLPREKVRDPHLRIAVAARAAARIGQAVIACYRSRSAA